jgi:hypothetical protein
MRVMSAFIEYWRKETMSQLQITKVKSSQRMYNVLLIEFEHSAVLFYCRDRNYVHLYSQAPWDHKIFILEKSFVLVEYAEFVAVCPGFVASVNR